MLPRISGQNICYNEPSCNAIRQAGQVLSTDISFSRPYEYEKSWDIIIIALGSPEPLIRLTGLKALQMISQGILRTIVAVNLAKRTRLIVQLIDIQSGSENWTERCLAAQMLGASVSVMMMPDFFTNIRLLAFQSVLDQFILLFPPNTDSLAASNNIPTIEIKTETTVQTFQSRIYYISALSHFFQIPESNTSHFMEYVDRVFCAIISSRLHPLLISAVVEALVKHLPTTSRNRMRIDHFYRSRIETLIANSYENEKQVIETANSTSTSSSFLASESKENSSSKSSIAQPESNLHPYLLRMIHLFWSVWYTRPSNATLLATHRNTEVSTSNKLGYAARQKTLLLASLAKETTAVLNPNVSGMNNTKLTFPYQQNTGVLIAPDFFSQNIHTYTPSLWTDMHTVSTPVAIMETPMPSVLTLNLKSAMLSFKHAPYHIDTFLQNTSFLQDISFHIQVYPHQLFYVTPSFGTVCRGESIRVKVAFTPQPFQYRKSSQVHGYLNIRRADGFPIERVSLSAYNTPSIKLLPPLLDFGFCPKGQLRTSTFIIVNLLPIECPVIVVMNPAISSGAFNLPQTQLILSPFERKAMSVKFNAHELDGPIEDEIMLISFGGEATRLPLRAMCSFSLKVLEQKLEFGPTDIYFLHVQKKLNLQNLDTVRSLAVQFSTSTHELVVNNNKHIVMQPGERRSVLVDFESAMSGVRQETIVVHAANTPPINIDVSAFSGPSILVPVLEDIYFPMVSIGTSATVMFPITNIGHVTAQLYLLVPNGCPITFKAMESDYSNRKLNVPNVVVDSKPHQTTEHQGISIVLSTKMTISIEIAFKHSKAGEFLIPLITKMTKPKNIEVCSHKLHCVVTNDAFLANSQTFTSLKNFYRKPFGEQMTPPEKFKVILDSSETEKTKASWSNVSKVLQISEAQLIVFGSMSKARNSGQLEYITLSNLTSDTQRYRIVLSFHFITDVPLDGEVSAASTIYIPVRLDPSLYLTQETMEHIALGSITVFDTNFNHPGFTCVQLYGVVNDLIWHELRRGISSIKFPRSRVMETFSRKIVVRNKSCTDLLWEGRLVMLESSIQSKRSTSEDMELSSSRANESSTLWNPFSLSVSQVTLKPFEYLVVDVSFTSNQPGDFKCLMHASYIDPSEHLGDVSEEITDRIRQKYELGPWQFECSVGVPDVTIIPDWIDFGDLAVSNTCNKSVIMLNNLSIDAEFVLASSKSIIPSKTNIKIAAKSTVELPIAFSPQTDAIVSELLSFNVGMTTHVMSLLGYGGHFVIDSNLACPQPVDSKLSLKKMNAISDGVVDFGFVSTESAKTKTLMIKNTGTIDIVISSLSSIDERYVTWEPQYIYGEELNWHFNEQLFGQEAPDAIEMDWDEHDWQMNQEKQLQNSSQLQNSFQQANSKPAQIDGLKLFEKITRQFNTNAKSIAKQSIFPLRLPPFQSFTVVLKFNGNEKGDYTCPLALEIIKSPSQKQTFAWWIKGSLQPPLIPWDKNINFGIKSVNNRHTLQIKFTNTGTKLLSWRLEPVGIQYTPLTKYDPPALPKNKSCIPNPISIFPEKGKLWPGSTQSVDVILVPNLAQYKIQSQFVLHTEDFSKQDIQIHAIGASSRLVLEVTNLDFGTLRVGTQKVLKIRLRNTGILCLKYFVESSHSQFQADPEQGVLDADCHTDLLVKFMPKSIGSVRSHLKITPISEESLTKDPMFVQLHGIGGYPELVVFTKQLDYGTALFKHPNRRVVKVQNKGAAEAHIVFNCFHPDIFLELDNQQNLIIGPHETKDIVVVYTPQIVERLDIKAFIRSSDSRGDNFMLTIRGSVGIPRLVIIPADALDSLDFGVMRLNKTYKKSFKIGNDGNIFLNYKISLVPIFQSPVQTDADFDSMQQLASHNIPSPIVVDPKSGTLSIGEETVITVLFTPTMLLEYEYQIVLAYDFQNFKGTVHGVGGCTMLKLDTPLKKVDFGVSRINRTYIKIVTLSNKGNLGFRYHARPEPDDGDWSKYDGDLARLTIAESKSRPETAVLRNLNALIAATPDTLQDEVPFWVEQLASKGVSIHNPDGNCPPRSKVNLIIGYIPKSTAVLQKSVRVYFGDHFETFEISGSGSIPQLYLRDIKGEQLISVKSSPQIDIGVHPVNSIYTHLFEIVNDGLFGVDFLVQPMISSEFDVFPLRGFIEPCSTSTLKVFFQPNSENLFHTTLRVLWEGKSLTAHIQGNGGVGRLEIIYLNDKDTMLKGLDFGMVPFNSACEKRFFVQNLGLVGVVAFFEVENEEYTITQFGGLIDVEDIKKSRLNNKGVFTSWYNMLRVSLPPNKAVELGTRFLARSATTSLGNITIRAECGNSVIPLKGKGGTILLSHRGDLDFGDISCNFTYTRKITIVNGGSIPSQLSVEWSVVGHSTEHASAYITLLSNYTSLDPRSGWAKRQYLCESGNVDPKAPLTAKEHWTLIIMMVRKSTIKELEIVRSATQNGPLSTGLNATEENPTMAPNTHLDREIGYQSIQLGKRSGAPAFSTHFKRRQMFYHLITSTQLTSQASSCLRPYIKVDPVDTTLQSYGEATFNIELHLGTEDTFLATLLVKSDVPNTPRHEISLTATPKIVNIVCDDTRILNFYRQTLGETEYITRSFTNVGHKDIAFKFINTNVGLTIMPSKGNLKVGQTLSIAFAFKPVDETIQSSDVIFDPNCSQPIRFKMYGGGGYAKASLSRYRRFDFGHCMIGKDTVSFLPITNEGNAILHLSRFEVVETDTFFKGKEWPSSRVSLFPGKSYNLPLVFNPHEENPSPGRLIIGTSMETYEIELIGLGREAVLIVSKIALEFSECLIGNSYEQKLGLKNIGDVNYPVKFQLEKEFPDLEFYPSSLVIDPFSESFVAITYTPSHEIRTAVVFSVSSPYSTHKVPVMVHAGVATLEFNSTEIDFGMFERTTRPSMDLVIKNTGTVPTSYHVKDVAKPSMFNISPAKGILLAGKVVTLNVTHIRHEVAAFDEKLVVKTDLIDKHYYIKVCGQCEETVLHPEEFSLVNMGICPVLESTSKLFTFKNHGRFPLEYSIKATYPLKVFPVQGRVLGEETGTVSIQWNPSGGYELRTQLSMVTNIGKYQVVVRGKAMFPEIQVNNMYLDYGVCAVGFKYRDVFIIENKGKVPVFFTIPPCKDINFSTVVNGGVLAAKEVMEIEVFFTPSMLGKISSSILVECKGIHYKEIVVVGVGGSMKTDVSPTSFNVGKCPFNLRVYETVTINNGGDVTLHVNFSKTELQQGICQIIAPESIAIGPWQSAKCVFGFSAAVVGHFTANLLFDTKEQSFCIPISGVGIKITLTERSKAILENEQIECTRPIHPFHVESFLSSFSNLLKRFHRSFAMDIKIAQLISQLYYFQRHGKPPQSQEFIFGTECGVMVDSKNLQEVIELPRLPTKQAQDSATSRMLVDSSPMELFEHEENLRYGSALTDGTLSDFPKLETPQVDICTSTEDPVGDQTADIAQETDASLFVSQPDYTPAPATDGYSDSIVSQHKASLGQAEMVTNDTMESAKTEPDPSSNVPFNDLNGELIQEVSHNDSTSQELYQSAQQDNRDQLTREMTTEDDQLFQVEKDASVSILFQTGATTDATESKLIAKSTLSSASQSMSLNNANYPVGERESELLQDDDLSRSNTHSESKDKHESRETVNSEKTTSAATVKAIIIQKETPEILERLKIIKALDELSQSATPIDISAIDGAFDQFIELKNKEQCLDTIPDDHIIHEVIKYGCLSVPELDINMIIADQEPSMEINLQVLTDRPPPFGNKTELDFSGVHGYEDPKRYALTFPSLKRKARNAQTDPFTDWKDKVIYGKGVDLFSPYRY
ncbi:hypothetical protein BDV3_006456 [Batrachochytrium dendrobatidis]